MSSTAWRRARLVGLVGSAIAFAVAVGLLIIGDRGFLNWALLLGALFNLITFRELLKHHGRTG